MGDPLRIEYRAFCGSLEGIMNMFVVLYKILNVVSCPIVSLIIWGYVLRLPGFRPFINDHGYFIMVLLILSIVTIIYNLIWVSMTVDKLNDYLTK